MVRVGLTVRLVCVCLLFACVRLCVVMCVLVWRLSDPTGSWVQLAPMSCSPRMWSFTAVLSDRIVVVAGWIGSGSLNDLCIFNGDTQLWSAPQPSPILQMSQAATVVSNNTLFIMGHNTHDARHTRAGNWRRDAQARQSDSEQSPPRRYDSTTNRRDAAVR